jgi:hypothetical protein
MLAIGQLINGHTVRHIIGQDRVEKPDGAVILVERWHPTRDEVHWVIARVSQHQIDAPEPVVFWDNGDYTEAVGSQIAPKRQQVMADLLARAGISLPTAPVEDPTLSRAVAIAADFPAADGDELDEMVHDHASRIGTEVNNNGVGAQIAYLLEHGESETDVRAALSAELAADAQANA